MGSDIVLNKKVLAANEILKYIRRGEMLSVAHLHGFDAEVVELVAERGAPITRKPLYELGGMRDKILIGGFCREGEWRIAVGSTHVHPGDTVIGICRSRHLRDLQGLILA
jgi:trk system potassium uptake protein TrkA